MNCLMAVAGENFSSVKITWHSPSPSNKNGVISSYYIVARFTSNDSLAKVMKLNVSEPVEEITDYSVSVAGLGEILYTLLYLSYYLT